MLRMSQVVDVLDLSLDPVPSVRLSTTSLDSSVRVYMHFGHKWVPVTVDTLGPKCVCLGHLEMHGLCLPKPSRPEPQNFNQFTRAG